VHATTNNATIVVREMKTLFMMGEMGSSACVLVLSFQFHRFV
jgi:hypothetical protein